MIKQAGIDFTTSCPNSGPDMDLLGEYTGAAVIFGATGGVMEAALRTVADILEEKDLPDFQYTAVRGADQGVKEAEVVIAGMKLRVAVAHSTGAASALLDAIRDGSAPQYHFIEIMGCPGGCVTGGGQPQIHAQDLMDIDVAKRTGESAVRRRYGSSGAQVPSQQAVAGTVQKFPRGSQRPQITRTVAYPLPQTCQISGWRSVLTDPISVQTVQHRRAGFHEVPARCFSGFPIVLTIKSISHTISVMLSITAVQDIFRILTNLYWR
jgi:hypothetical protein